MLHDLLSFFRRAVINDTIYILVKKRSRYLICIDYWIFVCERFSEFWQAVKASVVLYAYFK